MTNKMKELHKFTNFLPVTPNKYADNLELAVEEFIKLSKLDNKQVKSFNINRLEKLTLDISEKYKVNLFTFKKLL